MSSQENSPSLDEQQSRIILGQLIDYGETLKELDACKDRLSKQPEINANNEKICKAEVEIEKQRREVLQALLENKTKELELQKEQTEFFKKAYDTCKRKPSWKCKLFSIIFTAGIKKCV